MITPEMIKDVQYTNELSKEIDALLDKIDELLTPYASVVRDMIKNNPTMTESELNALIMPMPPTMFYRSELRAYWNSLQSK